MLMMMVMMTIAIVKLVGSTDTSDDVNNDGGGMGSEMNDDEVLEVDRPASSGKAVRSKP